MPEQDEIGRPRGRPDRDDEGPELPRSAKSAGGLDASTDVASRLIASSSSFAQSAVTAYVAGSLDIYYLHLATAVEHLVKGVLASVHPSFIADPRGDFDSLLHLTGMGHLARTPDFAGSVRTISVGEALRRVGRVVDGYQEPGDYVHVLLETRNGIVHAGYGVRQESEIVLGDVARYLAPLLLKAGMTDSAYWGDVRDLVAQHADRRLNDIEAAYGRAIQAARDRYALRVKEMSEIAISAFVAAVEPKGPSADFTTFPVKCPACEHAGTLSGDPEPSWEPDWDYGDGQAYVAGMYVDTITLHASRFECPVCNLALADADLELADIDALTFRDSAFDTGLAFVHFRRIEAEESLADWDR